MRITIHIYLSQTYYYRLLCTNNVVYVHPPAAPVHHHLNIASSLTILSII